MTTERRQEMMSLMWKWKKIAQMQQSTKIKYLASLIGKINFLRLQFKRGGLHMRVMNQMKNKAAQQYGWNGYLWTSRRMLPELFWWISQIHSNQPTRATLPPVEAILRTDASEDGWGTELEILKTGMKIKESGKWNRYNWRLTGSNQRKTAAILQGI
ncbi:MAG: hypothetical protein EZS28_003262 [Streblomastix strix]|uniref:Uncharacterized protein n=1 Tax=Streblomastix strix TaxID=222440 RepID=A0A5J4X1P2_9EUKA|nr:MAG: hypothetical protein EZS28_003262 [Streblomastix strix]